MSEVSPFDGVAQGTGVPVPVVAGGEPPVKTKTPLYPRLLRLQHVHPNAWQRAALGEGAVGVGVLLSMADLATAWSIVALPVAVAVVVKAHDALQGVLDRGSAADADDRSPELGLRADDLAVLGGLMDEGADLTQPRHVLHFLYAPQEAAARAIAAAADAQGYAGHVREPDEEITAWSVVCEKTVVLDPATVRGSRDLFDGLARAHGAEYDGWEAAV